MTKSMTFAQTVAHRYPTQGRIGLANLAVAAGDGNTGYFLRLFLGMMAYARHRAIHVVDAENTLTRVKNGDGKNLALELYRAVIESPR